MNLLCCGHGAQGNSPAINPPIKNKWFVFDWVRLIGLLFLRRERELANCLFSLGVIGWAEPKATSPQRRRAASTNSLFSLQQLNNSLFCGCGWKSQQKSWVCCWFVWEWAEWIEWKWSLVLLSLGGLRAGPPAIAPHKEDKPKQTNFTKWKEWSNQTHLFISFFSQYSINQLHLILWKWNQIESWWLSWRAISSCGRKEPSSNSGESEEQISRKWIHEFVGYELAAHLRGSTPQINFTYIQLICLASLAACSAKQRRAHSSLSPLFFGAQPKKKSRRWEKLRQLDKKR